MKKILIIVALIYSATLVSQSPWTQKKGKFYTQLSFSTISNYNDLFGDPDYQTEREISDQTFQFYSEYGLSDRTSLLLSVPFKAIQTGSLSNQSMANPLTVEASESSLGNIQFGIKHVFSSKNWVISGQFSLEANTGSFAANSGIRTGYDAWSFTPLFLIGKGYGKSYLQGFFGADIRTNGYSSNFKIGGEYGRKLGKSIWLIGFLDISKSFKNGDVILPNSNLATGLYVNNQEFGAFGLKAIGEITEKFGVNAGFGGAFFGNNVAKQLALSLGIYQKF